jgi:hypothetical protein
MRQHLLVYAAHAAVLSFDGIERQRLPEKRCGVYVHDALHDRCSVSSVEALVTALLAAKGWRSEPRRAPAPRVAGAPRNPTGAPEAV